MGANGIGDVNGDGYVDPGDVADVERIMLGENDPRTNQPYTAAQIIRADANGDGIVDIADVLAIEQYYTGARTTLPYARLMKAQQWGLALKYHRMIFPRG